VAKLLGVSKPSIEAAERRAYAKLRLRGCQLKIYVA